MAVCDIGQKIGLAVFKIGFDRWLDARKPHDFAAHIREAAAALELLSAAGTAQAKPPRRRR